MYRSPPFPLQQCDPKTMSKGILPVHTMDAAVTQSVCRHPPIYAGHYITTSTSRERGLPRLVSVSSYCTTPLPQSCLNMLLPSSIHIQLCQSLCIHPCRHLIFCPCQASVSYLMPHVDFESNPFRPDEHATEWVLRG